MITVMIKTIKFILESRVEQYLIATEDISKIIELVSLTTKERNRLYNI
jgi:hypothetical protein